MNEKQRDDLDDAIAILEHQIIGLAITLSIANTKINEMRSEIDRLKAIRDGKHSEWYDTPDLPLDLTTFAEALPPSIRSRVIKLAHELEEDSDGLLTKLWQEAHALQLYDAIYADVDAAHDLSNPILSRTVRGCVDHGGRVPDGVDRDILLRECPQVLAAIESAYDKHIRLILPIKSPTP